MAETVTYQKESGVGILTLNRPEVYNAFNGRMTQELTAALKEASKDPDVRAVMIQGAGKAFCSGQDLNDRSDLHVGNLSLGDSVRTRYNPMIRAITGMEKPVIASVGGVAAGAGCSLAFACDIRIVSEKAKFIEAFIRIGLVPDSGSSYFLPRLVGFGRAMELLMTGRDILAEEAVKIGLANRLVSHERLEEESFEFARKLAQAPTRAIGLTKRALWRAVDSELEEALEYEAQMQETAGKTEDFKEGVQAFTEKRVPEFRGK
ncbi:2-(1,2-epoxy-1,2-dihydrophenyl)acetyl-CoA isomerase [Melghirimyces profundicolus]|uniref:2-(1,2-epoxy-1,2-dihydrophenyl)acetyl-CoA isomerase n=1 Tax=Melghirimyces profundicolus TaxID=1242148 RepID=A0A2T6C7G2_9BACL|nr:enoyl-CoA hydratase-related protein [Melghirimyces profundicolus]PTX64232.1 2-(1,2-epoxy-1,2-dihydrophenyl)acetyl-CoA isomerase [Melghirimyces profundicolus]